MKTIDDTKLSALLDGELPSDEAADLEARLEKDETGSRRLAQLREVDNRLLGAVDRLEQAGLHETESNTQAQPGPARLVDMAVPIAANDNWWRLPLTASVALLVGLIAGNSLSIPMTGQSDFPIMASFDRGSAIGDFLEKTSSGEGVKLGNAKGEIRLTFFGTDGNPCREFVLEKAGSATQAVACRRPRGDWISKFEAVASSNSQQTDSLGYQTASSENEAFGQAVSAMMHSDALDAAREKQLIESYWKE